MDDKEKEKSSEPLGPLISTREVTRGKSEAWLFETVETIKANGENVDYYVDRSGDEPRPRRHEELKWVFSQDNDRDKYTEGLYDCMCLIVIGTDIETGKQISLLSHLNPKRFLDESYREEFVAETTTLLQRIKERVRESSLSALLLGGKQNDAFGHSEILNEFFSGKKEYEGSKKIISELCIRTLGISPTLPVGPNIRTEHGDTSVYLSTQTRAVYIVRPEQK